ncbi:MAG TPA: DEAD/DEAH box helicase [Candidatus Eisenbacteria bacterium]|nr:DEAD/DEAH box helicase [Candidatus Eisenbacteria bacterium]
MFRYDPFQEQAIRAIDEEKSVLVSAPTGAGKTAIAEYAIDKALARGERVIYTAPIKALSNQKYRDFSLKYPDQVGLLTGDVTLNGGAQISIMTTEIYRNQLFEDPERLRSTSWVIFDEVHYLDDPERGTVWEEAIMFSPEHVRFLALSATAPNVEELAEWIRSILNHPIEVVIERHRPVPLVNLFQCQGKVYSDPVVLRREGYLGQDHWPSDFHGRGGHRQQQGGRRQNRQWQQNLRAKPNRTDDLVRHLIEANRLPALYFAFGRKRTEELAWEMQKFDLLAPEEKVQVDELYNRLSEKFDLTKEASACDMKRLLDRGIAFHHAGMLPTLKEVIEQLFTSKLIKLIFTTETFAIGINMPAKTVVFDELRKFYGTGFAFLRTRDFFQMAGRAGRRGKDKEGYVYTRINPHQTPYTAVTRVLFGQQEPIESQFNSCYATLLNLYGQFGEKLLEIYPRSLHYYQSNRKGRMQGAAAMEKKLALLAELGHLGGGKLTVKGQFASWMYGYELLLSEMLEAGYLEMLDEARLSALLAALVFEPRRNQIAPKLPPQIAGVEAKALSYLKKIHHKEGVHKIYPPTKQPHFHLATALEAWLGGADFHELGKYTDVDDGEIIRYFRMVIQLLRQLKQAPQVSERLREIAGSAQKKINRDLVDAEKQLRNM